MLPHKRKKNRDFLPNTVNCAGWEGGKKKEREDLPLKEKIYSIHLPSKILPWKYREKKRLVPLDCFNYFSRIFIEEQERELHNRKGRDFFSMIKDSTFEFLLEEDVCSSGGEDDEEQQEEEREGRTSRSRSRRRHSQRASSLQIDRSIDQLLVFFLSLSLTLFSVFLSVFSFLFVSLESKE